MMWEGTIKEEVWGEVEGEAVTQWTLTCPALSLSVISWGATITRLEVPDRRAEWGNVVLGFDSMVGYLSPHNRWAAALFPPSVW